MSNGLPPDDEICQLREPPTTDDARALLKLRRESGDITCALIVMPHDRDMEVLRRRRIRPSLTVDGMLVIERANEKSLTHLATKLALDGLTVVTEH